MVHEPPPQGPRNTRGSGASALAVLASGERAEVFAALLAAHPDLVEEAERLATGLLASPSLEEIASEVVWEVTHLTLEDLAGRAGRVPGRGYVHETEAAWELVEEVIETLLGDVERRAALGLGDAACRAAAGIIAGLYRLRGSEDGTVLAYAGEDTPGELAAIVAERTRKLGLIIDADLADAHWPHWHEL